MERKMLEKYIQDDLSTWDISTVSGKSQSTVRYWLKKYNLKTNYYVQDKNANKKRCIYCDKVKLRSEFYTRNSGGLSSHCKMCFSTYKGKKLIDKKIEALKYKGNRCEDCDLSYPEEPYAVFDFHHDDPSAKEFNWNQMRQIKEEKMYKELDKCVLLCANCHRKRHHYDRNPNN